MDIVRPRWSSSTFLLYTGGIVVFLAGAWSLTLLGGSYRQGALAAWAGLVFGVLAGVALAFRRAGRRVAAGVFAVAAVLAFAVLVSFLERWWGWLGQPRSAFGGVDGGLVLLELALLAASAGAIVVFRFPLAVAPACAAGWYFVTDVASEGGRGSAAVTFVLGLLFLVLALRLDRTAARPYGFWVHVAAGLTIGGSLLYFWHSTDLDWGLVACAGALYVGYASVLGRSSWTVLGALGLFLAAAHFSLRWASGTIVAPLVGVQLGGGGGHRFAGPLVYAFLGALLVALGLAVERDRA